MVISAAQLTLRTQIFGTINGTNFSAAGEARWTSGEAAVKSILAFDRPIANFIPLLCKSWKCKHHRAIPPADPENFFATLLANGEIIYDLTLITYPHNYGQILSSSQSQRVGENLQLVTQTRLGNYSGPIDITAQLPFEEQIKPAGPGKAVAESLRRVRRSDGSLLEIEYYEVISFPQKYELSGEITLEYGGSATWDPARLELSLDTVTTYRTL